MKSYRPAEISLLLFYLPVSGLVGFLLHAAARNQLGQELSLVDFAWPLILYFFAHLFRAFRLALLINASQLRRLFAMHFYTAACSAIIPFKLGEIVRLNEISQWCASFWRGLLIFWIERTFDIIALAALLVLVLTSGVANLAEIRSLAWLIGGFIIITTVIFFILPEQLFRLNLHVIRTYKGRKALHILRIVDGVYDMLQHARPLLVGKLTALSLLTFLVWAFELAAVLMIADVASLNMAAFYLVRQFSETISNYSAGLPVAKTIIYFAFLKQMLLGVLGLIALAFYLKWRTTAFRPGKSTFV
jgi:hypothetical protein